MFRSSAIQNIQLGLFLILATVTSFCYAGNYTWNGNTSTAWTTSSNWTPSGVPGSTDTVTIVTGSRNVYLAANTSVKQLTMTSGTIDLQTYTLSVSATGMFTSGQINNGTLSLYGTSTITFKGTTFGAVVSATGNSILLNGSTFNDSLSVVKKGTAGDNGKGGNTFNGAVSIIDSASGNLVLSDSFPDVFNSRTWVTNRSTGKIYIAHRGTSNQFNGDVTFAGKNIWSNYYGTASYNGNITFDTPNGEVYFGYSTGNCSLSSGKNLFIGTNGFSAGFLYLRNFVQSDSTISVSLTLTGTAKIAFESGTSIKANVAASAPFIYLEGTRFLGTCSITTTGSSNITSLGGSYFAKATTIFHNPSAACTFTSGSTSVDTFASPVILKNGIGTMSINNSLFLDSVSFKNLNSVTGSDRYYVANTGNARMKGKVVLDNTLAGMNFGNSGGATTLDSAASMSVLSTFTGNLTLKKFIQKGSNSVSIALNNSSTKLILNSGTSFDGSFTYYGRNIQLNGTTFNSTTEITRYGTSGDVSSGGNIFNGNTTIRDSSSHNHDFILGASFGDDFNSTVTLIQFGTGVNLLPAYSSSSSFSGDVYVGGSSVIQFGSNGGKVVIDGNTNNSISKLNSFDPTFRNFIINKSNGSFILSTSILIKDTVEFLKGNIESTSTNYLTLDSTSVTLFASDSSFNDGPIVKKVVSNFDFPTGKDARYLPISISQLTSNSTFKAEYFNFDADSIYPFNSKDTLTGYISHDGYWYLEKISGTGTGIVTLSWNNSGFGIRDIRDLAVIHWNGSIWTNKSNQIYSGNSRHGTVQAKDTNSSFYRFALGNSIGIRSIIDPNPDRGLYVDKFFTEYSAGSGIDPNNTILGNATKENELLDYCKVNHFTHLVLYDIRTVLLDGYATQLCNFLNKAKNSPYCIMSIGAAGPSEEFFCAIYNQPSNCNTSSISALTLSSSEQALIGSYSNDLLDALTNGTISSSDPQFGYSQLLRFYWNLMAIPQLLCNNGEVFDFMSIELEFWSNRNSYSFNVDFVKLMNDVNWIRANVPLAQNSKIELYLGRMTDNKNQATWGNPEIVTAFIDGYNHSSSCNLVPSSQARQEDRVLLHSYVNDPTTAYNYGGNGGVLRTTYFKDPCTIDETIIHPIFSAERLDLQGDGDFSGRWIYNNAERNIFEVERFYYINYLSDQVTTTNENVITPGACHWFAQSFMQNYLSNPPLFKSNSPVCTTTGNDGVLQFDYIGPIEEGTQYVFTVSGAGATCSTSGSIPQFTGTGYAISLPSCSRAASTTAYIATLTLDFGCGTTSYSTDVYVTTTPLVSIATPNSSNLCEGNGVSLHASNGTSYIWDTGATTENITVHSNGIYTCTISGGNCPGSNTISVQMQSNPDFIITPSCNSNNTSLDLTVSPFNGGISSINWSTSSASNSSVINTSSSGNYFATVTTGQCTRQHSQSISEFPILQPIIDISPGGLLTYCIGFGVSETLSVHNAANLYSSTVTFEWFRGSSSVGVGSVYIAPPSTSTTSYTVRAKKYGCYQESTPITFTVNPLPTITLSPNPAIICNGSGNISLQASGTSTSYSWNPSTGLNCSTCSNPTATLSSSLTYTITGTDANGCSNTLTQQVTIDPSMSASVSGTAATCIVGYNNGSAVVSLSGGSGSNTYSWNPTPGGGQNTNSVTGLTSQVYTVTITDLNSCTVTSSVSIGQALGFSLGTASSPSNCTAILADGSATVSVTPSGSYSYLWDNWADAQTTATATNLDPRTYYVTVSSGSCNTSTSVTVSDNTTYQTNPSPITGTVNWNSGSTMKIKGLVEIKDGGVLNITNNTIVQFSYDLENVLHSGGQRFYRAGIKVQPGGKLYVNGTTTKLTGCDGGIWDGIQMPGLTKIDQSQTGSEKQPEVHISGGATIENAYVGVDVATSNYFYLSSYWPVPEAKSGGILTTDGANFKNNRTGILFPWKYRYPTVSYINSTNFLYDDNSPYKDEYSTENPMTFISINGNSGLRIANSNFTSSVTGVDPTLNGVGIKSVNSGFSLQDLSGSGVGNNTFNNLMEGINAKQYTSSAYSIVCEGNDFNSVYQSIYIENGGADIINSNAFNVPEISGNVDQSYGINMINSNGFLISFNNFFSPSNTQLTYGAAFNKSNGMVWQNQFLKTSTNTEAFFIQVQTDNDCSLLSLRCNSFENPNTYSWYIRSGTLMEQGIGCNNADEPAGNEWLYNPSCSGEENIHISSIGANGFLYHAHNGDVSGNPTTIPSCASLALNLNTCFGLNKTSTSCDHRQAHLIDPPPTTAYSTYISYINSLIGAYKDSVSINNDLATKYIPQIKLLEFEKARQMSTYSNTNAIKAILWASDSPESKKQLVEIYYRENNKDSMQIVLNLLQNDTVSEGQIEKGKYIEMMTVVKNATDSIGNIVKDSLSTSSLSDIESSETKSSHKAEALLDLKQDLYSKHPIPEFNENNSRYSIPPTNQNSNFKLYPNPTQNELSLELDQNVSTLNLVIVFYNVMGEIILNKSLKDCKSISVINISNFCPGVYQAIIYDTSDIYLNHKFVVIK